MQVPAIMWGQGDGRWVTSLACAATLGVAIGAMLRGGSDSSDGGSNNGTTPEGTMLWKAYQTGSAADDGQATFHHERLPKDAIKQRAKSLFDLMHLRRSVRMFSSDPVPIEVLHDIIATAGTAPSGAHCQPWHFVLVKAANIKQGLREIVENEEKVNYEKRMRADWVDECKPLVAALPNEYTKPYLTEAPYVIVALKKVHDIGPKGEKIPVRYPVESCGLACGMLITAIHNANLATLTSTPMNADSKIRALLKRPDNERVFLLLPVGYPAKNGKVPARDENKRRRPLSDIMSFF